MPPSPKHKRRRFQYSLGAMLAVVTAVALVVAWALSELKFVQARKAFPFTQGMAKSNSDAVSIPFWRRWYGDKAVAEWAFPHDAPEETLARARHLFPEAEIRRLTPSEEPRMMPQVTTPQGMQPQVIIQGVPSFSRPTAGPQPPPALAPGPSTYRPS
jgi:hypothetical protein